MEARSEQIIPRILPVARSRTLLHLVEGMEHGQANHDALITHAGPSSIGGIENQGIMDAITAMRRVALILMHRGFVVLSVNLARRAPRIVIKGVAKCDELGGIETQRIVTTEYIDRILSVEIHDVKVEWTIRRPL